MVRKWKWVKQDDGTNQRIIRSRLCVRGFKDREADTVDTYSGTTTRWSQRLVCSIAATHGWPLACVGIEKAFLQGCTYEELAKEGKARDVTFTLPKGVMPLLRKLPGLESFTPETDVLRCLKPGTGLKDAPAAFSRTLQSITRG